MDEVRLVVAEVAEEVTDHGDLRLLLAVAAQFVAFNGVFEQRDRLVELSL
ncbi:MAG: hypothetical protein ABI972_07580 [Acidobacteriota bacterium]